MLWSLKELLTYKVQASDGVIGRIHDLFFCPEDWTLRFLLVDTGAFFPGRKILINREILGLPDKTNRNLILKLTKNEVESFQNSNADEIVIPMKKAAFSRRFNPPNFGATREKISSSHHDFHGFGENFNDKRYLGSARRIFRCHIQTLDGDVGRVEDIILEDRSWSFRYFAFIAREMTYKKDFVISKKILIMPRLVEGINWRGKKIYVDIHPFSRVCG